MSIQEFIDAIDPTKPVNRTSTQKPTLKSLRDNTAAIKNALQAIENGVVSQNTHYEIVVTGAFNEDVVYMDGSNKVPDFVVDESGDIVYAEVYN